MEQQTGYKLGKECPKPAYCYPAYLTDVHSTAHRVHDWVKHNLESRRPGEMSISSDMQVTQPLRQKVKRNLRAS